MHSTTVVDRIPASLGEEKEMRWTPPF
jgi:hypothetical protein